MEGDSFKKAFKFSALSIFKVLVHEQILAKVQYSFTIFRPGVLYAHKAGCYFYWCNHESQVTGKKRLTYLWFQLPIMKQILLISHQPHTVCSRVSLGLWWWNSRLDFQDKSTNLHFRMTNCFKRDNKLFVCILQYTIY